MRLKLTLDGRQGGPADVVINADVKATVGDVADALALRDPAGPRSELVGSAALTLHTSDSRATLVARETSLNRSAVRSGSRVSLTPAAELPVEGASGPSALLSVLTGPEAGRTFQLPVGRTTIGRAPEADIRLSDPLVSKVHAAIEVTDVVEIIDLNSSNGVEVGGGPVPRAILRDTDVALIGDTQVRVSGYHFEHPQDRATASISFTRSPRVETVFGGRTWQSPRLPNKPSITARIGVATMLAPILMGGVLFLITRSAISLAFMALSPMMAVASWIENKGQAKRTYKDAVERFELDFAELETEMADAARTEEVIRRSEHPSVERVAEAAASLAPLLWTRRPEHESFGTVVLGRGEQPSRSSLEEARATEGEREFVERVAELRRRHETVQDVPIVTSLSTCGNLGVCGRGDSMMNLARGLIVHLTGLHAPSEMQVVVFASSGTSERWDWLKWLPHTWSEPAVVSAPLMTAGEADALSLVSALEDLIEQRTEQSAREAVRLPLVLVVVDDESPAERARLVQLGERGPAVGLHLVWCAVDLERLPAVCRTFVDGTIGSGVVGLVREGATHLLSTSTSVSAEAAKAFALSLSPVVDSGARPNNEADVPNSVSLLTMVGQASANDPLSVLDRWNETFSLYPASGEPMEAREQVGGLRALVGESEAGRFALDLRLHGPHALIGGTTGAGKSEFLQSWILGLASTYSPQRVTFLFVDYKGGSAFGECLKLPHTVGLVTDLTPHLVNRALASFRAELERRERLLDERGLKDVTELEKAGDPACPPSLVIVIDEFAALAHDVPDFVDGVVDVAQRGRSLGLHLIMATQRPAGVIRENLRANTNLRVALRMADESDSQDVVGTPAAAAFAVDAKGRAIAKTGPGKVDVFQSAYAGGHTAPEGERASLDIDTIGFGTPARWTDPPAPRGETPPPVLDSDVKRVVRTIRAASESAKISAPRKPWQPPLREVYDLHDLSASAGDDELVIGMLDVPKEQQQVAVGFRPDEGNLAVFGAGGSGKTSVLRAVAAAAAAATRDGFPCHVYGIDFGSRGLRFLETLPNVGTVVESGDDELLVRLVRWLDTTLADRISRFSASDVSSLEAYRLAADRPAEPRIVIVVDDIAAFRKAFESPSLGQWYDAFVGVAARGRSVGIHVVMTSDRPGGLGAALNSTVQQRLVLRMPQDDDLLMLGVPRGSLTAESGPGRGFLDKLEMQVAVLGEAPGLAEQVREFTELGESLKAQGVQAAARIAGMPEVVLLQDLPEELERRPVVGLAEADLRPVSIPDIGVLVVAGASGSGRTSTVITVVSAVRRLHPSVETTLITGAHSDMSSLLDWGDRSSDSSTSVRLLKQVLDRAAVARQVVVIENAMAFASDIELDQPLQDLCRVARERGVLVVADADYDQIRMSFGLAGELKRDRQAIALSPEYYAANAAFDAEFPRLDRVMLPIGRGVLLERSRTTVLQVAMAT